MKKRLAELLRAAKRKRNRKIRATRRPWLNLVRLCTGPCQQEGVTCSGWHTSRYKAEAQKIVAWAVLVAGVAMLFCFCVVMAIADKSEHPAASTLFAMLRQYSWAFFIAWFASSVGWAHLEYDRWSDHASALARERERLKLITLGTLLTDELKERIAAAKQRLLEGDAGLTVWRERVDARLKELPATEVATMPLPGGDRPYQATASVTVVQVAADQADLVAVAGAYRGLAFRIAETVDAYNSLAVLLGQSIDRRDELGRTKGATDFDPSKNMADITREVSEKLDRMFMELKALQTDVSNLNSRAENALSSSVVKNITKAISGVRVSFDGNDGTDEAAISGGSLKQARQNGK